MNHARADVMLCDAADPTNPHHTWRYTIGNPPIAQGSAATMTRAITQCLNRLNALGLAGHITVHHPPPSDDHA